MLGGGFNYLFSIDIDNIYIYIYVLCTCAPAPEKMVVISNTCSLGKAFSIKKTKYGEDEDVTTLMIVINFIFRWVSMPVTLAEWSPSTLALGLNSDFSKLRPSTWRTIDVFYCKCYPTDINSYITKVICKLIVVCLHFYHFAS